MAIGKTNVGGGGGGSLNIFCQTDQPNKENGLWVKTDDATNVIVGEITGSVDGSVDTAGVAIPTTCIVRPLAESFGNTCYFFDSYYTDSGSSANELYKYNTETNTIEIVDGVTIPASRSGTGVATAKVGSNFYLIGGSGSNGNRGIYTFDTETETITLSANALPYYVSQAATSVVGTNIYIFGGCYYDEDVGTKLRNSIVVFDTETNISTQLSTVLPTVLKDASSGKVGTSIYILGGVTSSGSSPTVSLPILEFDTLTNTITTLTTEMQRALMGSCEFGDKIYLFGGVIRVNISTSVVTTVSVFDTTTRTLTDIGNLPQSLCYMSCVKVNNTFYLLGGSTSTTYSSSIASHVIYKMVVDSGLENGTVVVEPIDASPYQTTLLQTPKYTLQPCINRVVMQVDGTLQKVDAAVINNSVITDIE